MLVFECRILIDLTAKWMIHKKEFHCKSLFYQKCSDLYVNLRLLVQVNRVFTHCYLTIIVNAELQMKMKNLTKNT